MLETILYVDMISTEMTIFNATWLFNTIEASFHDIIPVLKTFEKGDWLRWMELKHLRKKSRKEVQSF